MKRHWERAKKRVGADADVTDQVAAMRAKVASLLASEDPAGAAAAYVDLLEQFGDRRAAVTLSRAHQCVLANYFYAEEKYEVAATAYEHFLEAYPHDAEAPQVRVLLGRINGRYLNDPVRARALLTEALRVLHDGPEAAFARGELESLGVDVNAEEGEGPGASDV
jgi:tetratricopeptide (TPR) repeat protein